MLCAKCNGENANDAHRCAHCGASLSVGLLEVIRGNLPEKIYFLNPARTRSAGPGTTTWRSPSPPISKSHARIAYESGGFSSRTRAACTGVYVNAAKVQKAALLHGAPVQLGNVTLKFSLLGSDGSTEQIAEFPWIEQQQLLLSLVQTLNSTLVLSQVLEQVLDAVMRITRAERGFLLLADPTPEAEPYRPVAGLQLRVGRHKGGSIPVTDLQGLSTSVVRKALETGETGGHGQRGRRSRAGHGAQRHPDGPAHHRLHPAALARGERTAARSRRGARRLYVDNQETSAPFSGESLRTAEALARHAAPGHRERAALRARATDDRGAAAGADAAAAVGEARAPSARWPPASPTS
jgi:hypothetical protein